jgi:hypothetical protein
MNLQVLHPSRLVLITALFLPLGACVMPYTVRLNDNVVYAPNGAQRDTLVQDPGLQACLDLAMERNEQTDPASVTLLACAGAGIQTLAGIEALVGLEQLELSDNQISNLSPLLPLRNLRVLGLRNNRIGDIRPLGNLPILRFLSLEGNDRVPCRQLDLVAMRLGNTFGRPQSCVE